MFKVMESMSTVPIRMVGVPNKEFKVGTVCCISEDALFCDVSNGKSSFGIISKGLVTSGSFSYYNMVEFFHDRMIIKTNVLEPGVEYETGNSLYVSKTGYLTTRKRDQVPVGKVISNFGNRTIEALWF